MSGYCNKGCAGHQNLNNKCTKTYLPQTPSTSSGRICDSYTETGCKWEEDPYGTAGPDYGSGVGTGNVKVGAIIDDPLWISIENDIIKERQRVGLATGPIFPSPRPATGVKVGATHYNSLVVALEEVISIPSSPTSSSKVITATSTFTVPPNVTSVNVCMTGGGGGGGTQWYNAGGINWQSGAGGGGSGAVTRTIAVTPDQRITVIIGAGGVANNTSGAVVGGGGTSSFGGSFSVIGGNPARNGNGISAGTRGLGNGGGGNGGNPSWDNYIIVSAGSASSSGCGGVNAGGAAGLTIPSVWGGGGGGGGGLGPGGDGAGNGVHKNGSDGGVGGGGGGGATGGNVSMARGGHGGSGKAIVTWSEDAGGGGGTFGQVSIGTIITSQQMNILIGEINSSASTCFCNCNFCACNCNNCACNCNYSCTCNCNY